MLIVIRMISVDAAYDDILMNEGDPDDSFENILDGGLYGAFAHSGFVIANDWVWEFAVDEHAKTRDYRYALAEVWDKPFIKSLKEYYDRIS